MNYFGKQVMSCQKYNISNWLRDKPIINCLKHNKQLHVSLLMEILINTYIFNCIKFSKKSNESYSNFPKKILGIFNLSFRKQKFFYF